MRKPKVLDLFCGAGGCSVGYARAGFEVWGVDRRKQPRYPFTFARNDALVFLKDFGNEFDVIHASPPCPPRTKGRRRLEPGMNDDVLMALRPLLEELGKPWVIETAPKAHHGRGAILLCGNMFRLKVYRHRLFYSSELLLAPFHFPHKRKSSVEELHSVLTPETLTSYDDLKVAIGIDWMNASEMSQAVPPAFTEFVGRQIITRLPQE